MKRLLNIWLLLLVAVALPAQSAVTVYVNGVGYTIPERNERGWGAAVTSWIQAISSNSLQKNGGTFTLTADTDFGATYGLKSAYFTSRTANGSGSGVLRLANTDSIGWRNAANSGNLLLSVNGSNQLTFNGTALSTAGSIVNADIDAAAAIARSKLASGTADHVLINNGSGVMSSEATLSKTRGGAGADMSSVTFPSTGTLVTRTATETLTNKTLTSPTITGATSTGSFTGTLVGADNTFVIKNSSDATKQIVFDASGLTTGATASIKATNAGSNAFYLPNSTDFLVGSTQTITLTNKTLTAPVISTITNTGTLTLPTATTTLVGRDTTDTLTNKTLSGNTATNLISGSGTLTLNTSGTITVPNGTDTLVGKATVDTLTSKTLSAPTLTAPNVSDYLVMSDQGSTPSTPISGLSRIYTKTDGKVYKITSAGVEQEIGSGSGGAYNMLSANPDWESASTSWTASAGTYSRTTTAAEVGFGTGGGKWVPPASAGATVTSTAVAIPQGLYGRNGLAYIQIKAASGTGTYLVEVYDGTNVLASATMTSSTSVFARTAINFPFPSSGNLSLRIKTVSTSEPTIYFDNAFVGDAINLLQVNQASVYGTATWPGVSACQWTTGDTSASFTVFGADTDCTSPTGSNLTGAAQAPATKIPGVTFTNLPPGDYVVMVNGNFVLESNTTATYAEIQLWDGTSASGFAEVNENSANDTISASSLTGRFSYTAPQSTITFQVRALSGSNTSDPRIGNSDSTGEKLQFTVMRFPSASELAMRADQVGGLWSGYHDSTCSWSTTGTSFATPAADGTCAFTEKSNLNVNFGTVASTGAKTPGITFTPVRAGRYQICSSANLSHTVSGGRANYRLYDGTNEIAKGASIARAVNENDWVTLCGNAYFSSTAAVSINWQLAVDGGGGTLSLGGVDQSNAVEWNIVNLDAVYPAPVFVGSVTSGSTSPERIERALITNTGTCTLTSQSGSWLSSVTDNGAGDCTLVIASGMFSATPVCTATPVAAAANRLCIVDSTTTPSATAQRFLCTNTSVGTDTTFNVQCMGPK